MGVSLGFENKGGVAVYANRWRRGDTCRHQLLPTENHHLLKIGQLTISVDVSR